MRSGAYALRCNPVADLAFLQHDITLSDVVYYTAHLRIASLPDITASIMFISGNAGCSMHLTASGTLQVRVSLGATQVGSDSSALSLDTWYRIDLMLDKTNNKVVGRLDTVEFVNATPPISLDQGNACRLGSGWGTPTFDIYFDDVAVNDGTGSFENTWTDGVEVIHLRPNAAGDNAQWIGQPGGGASSYANVDEVTPNDGTDYNEEGTVGDIDDWNIDDTPAALAADDDVSCVQVGHRYQHGFGGASWAGQHVLRIKASAGGTVEESANSEKWTPWTTHSGSTPQMYILTLYDLPGASVTAWTKADLDVAQVGCRMSTAPIVGRQAITALWVCVTHKAAVVAVKRGLAMIL